VARLYIDEAGTHGGRWLVIGVLVVPAHAALHNALVRIKMCLSIEKLTTSITEKLTTPILSTSAIS